MPTQEDRVLSRIKQTIAFIRDQKDVEPEKIEAWAYTTLGIRTRTIREYLKSLLLMGNIKYDPKKRVYFCETKVYEYKDLANP